MRELPVANDYNPYGIIPLEEIRLNIGFLLIIAAVILVLLVFIIAIIALVLFRYQLSPNRRTAPRISEGNLEAPTASDLSWRESSQPSQMVINQFASLDLPDWKKNGKVMAPRIAMAKLYEGIDAEEVNEYLLSKEPWGAPGSTWLFHPRGDYDFTMIALAAVLHLYHKDGGPIRDETARHIAAKLIGIDNPTKRCDRVPLAFGLIIESENHILMTTGSRYLALKWADDNEIEYDVNDLQVLEDRTIHILKELHNPGPYEFNSDPYFGYTLTAALILEAFGSPDVRKTAREVLDRLNYNYALSSMGLRRMPPFRRKWIRGNKTTLIRDYHSSLMEIWYSLYVDEDVDSMILGGHEHSLMAAILPYRPPDEVMAMLENKDREYLVRIGHGKGSSPEIYSGGPGFLISSGGTPRYILSRIAVRPSIVLMDDGENDIGNVLRLEGSSKHRWKWNNTGVHRRFAVSSCPVRIPRSWIPLHRNGLWRIYQRTGITIGVHSGDDLGIICILDEDPGEAYDALNRINGDRDRLKRSFEFPDGRKISYDVRSPKNKGVITAVDDEEIDRDLDTWPLLNGEFV